MNKFLKIFLVAVLFVLLLLVRAFETNLFYDPLIEYFKNDYLYKYINDIDNSKLLFNMFYRFILNSVISIGIIWTLFERKDLVKFSTIFLVFAFLVLISIFAYLLQDNFKNGYLLPFYIRRFIIHPIFLLLLLPAFYFQKLSNK